MAAHTSEELESIARRYVIDHFPALRGAKAARLERQAKTPGAPRHYVFDFSGTASGMNQRVRLVLDEAGKVLKVTASR